MKEAILEIVNQWKRRRKYCLMKKHNPLALRYVRGIISDLAILESKIDEGKEKNHFKFKKLSYFGVLIRLPQIFYGHYKILRESNSKRESIRVSFYLTKTLII